MNYEKQILYYNYLKDQNGGRDNLTILNKINDGTITTDELDKYAQEIELCRQYQEYLIEQIQKVKLYYIHITEKSNCYNSRYLNIINETQEKLKTKHLNQTELETISQQKIEIMIKDLETWAIKLDRDYKGRNAKLKRILNGNSL
jgi:plasmid rolling circle replication initiator protein Rep